MRVKKLQSRECAATLVKIFLQVVVVLLTVGSLGLNCWGMLGLGQDFDRTWFLGPGYQTDFVTALRNLFPESGDRAEFYLGMSIITVLLSRSIEISFEWKRECLL